MNIALVLTTVNAQHVTGIEFVAIIRAAWAGGVLNKVLYGEARPVVQPLALLHTISGEKGSPFGLFTDRNDRFPCHFIYFNK